MPLSIGKIGQIGESVTVETCPIVRLGGDRMQIAAIRGLDRPLARRDACWEVFPLITPGLDRCRTKAFVVPEVRPSGRSGAGRPRRSNGGAPCR